MAIQTFPGVFIEEVPSTVRTITGVATSIAAFVGRTQMGPVNEPVLIGSLGDFQRTFGGLRVDLSVGYAVRDFFLNGGTQAVIVRLFRGTTADPTVQADQIATLSFTESSAFTLRAANPGAWGGNISVVIDRDEVVIGTDASNNPITTLDEVAASLGVQNQNLFSLTITVGGTVETIKNLTLVDSARRYDRVLAEESSFVRAPATLTTVTDARTLVNATTKRSAPSTASVGTTNAADGAPLQVGDYITSTTAKQGVQALEKTDLFNLLCIPPDTRPDSWGNTDPAVYQGALQYCVQRRAMLVVDPPTTMTSVGQATATLAALGLSGVAARNAVFYYPRVLQADPLRSGRQDAFVPCGIVSGIMAQTDGSRGVWKAPAGIDAGLLGIQGLKDNLTDLDNGVINPLGINALRTFPVVGTVVWGARTLRGADQLADDYKYLPVRRTALFLEESLVRGTRFAVFEPNDEPLWSQLRLTIGAFLNNLFRQGAFQGQSAREAFFVKVDKETTTQNDINLGVVNILVGFAPLKPAEFVIIKLQQIAGQVAA